MNSLVGLPSMHSLSGTMHSLAMGCVKLIGAVSDYAKFSQFTDYAQFSHVTAYAQLYKLPLSVLHATPESPAASAECGNLLDRSPTCLLNRRDTH